MHLHSALERIADVYRLDAGALKNYADEDPHTGWDKGAGEWPIGSLWRVEGQVLYALVRALRPARALELGTGYGCSATHILTALQRNGTGTLHGVDNGGDPTAVGQIGSRIPDDLRSGFSASEMSIEAFLETPPDAGYDLIFEDGIHSPAQVFAVWERRDALLNPGGVLVSHDATHFIVGADVRGGIERAGVDDALYLSIDPSDCGLAVWRQSSQPAPVVEAKPKPTPKPRTRKAKPKA